MRCTWGTRSRWTSCSPRRRARRPRTRCGWHRDAARARGDRSRLSGDALEGLCGDFGEVRTAGLDGHLFVTLPGDLPMRAAPLGDGSYSPEGREEFRLLFDLDAAGVAAGLTVISIDGEERYMARRKP